MDAHPSRTRLALGLAAGLAGAAAFALLLRRSRRKLRIARLTVFPVKGCKGIDVRSVRLTPEGLEHDREFVIVAPQLDSWRFVSQREAPRLARVQPSMPSAEGGLEVTAPGMPKLSVSPPGAGAARRALEIWGDAAEGIDCGDAAADWFSEFLGTPGVRLLRHVGVRRIDENFAKGATMFADGFPVLLTTEASLANVERSTGLGLSQLRFRPNIVLAGAGEFVEDTVKGVRCGLGASASALRFVKPCARCQVPAVDPVKGERGEDPIRELKRYRTGRALMGKETAHAEHFQKHMGEVFFGQNAVPELAAGTQASLAVGDPAEWM